MLVKHKKNINALSKQAEMAVVFISGGQVNSPALQTSGLLFLSDDEELW
jgi:hypothetical protein